MKKIRQQFVFGIAFLFASVIQADSLPFYSVDNNFVGIWQDQDNPLHYYSLQYNAKFNTFILVDLSAIEKTQDTLQSSYAGELNNFISNGTTISLTYGTGTLSRFKNKEIGLQVKLNIDLTGTLTPTCGPAQSCAGSIVKIKKVF